MCDAAVQAHVTAVILAGGQGARIRHLLRGLPKPMVPVGGRPFLDWVLWFLRRQGIERAVISTGYRSDVIEEHCSRGVENMDVIVAAETQPLGTAGGFVNAAQAAPGAWRTGAWLVVNGDSLTVCDWAPLFALLSNPRVAGGLLAVRAPDAGRYGTLDVSPEGRVARFAEKKPGRGLINAGVYLLRHELLALFPQKRPLSFETDVFPSLLGRTRIEAAVVDAPMLDIGVPEALASAEAFVRRHEEWFQPAQPHPSHS